MVRSFDYSFGWVYVSIPLYGLIDTPLFDNYNMGVAIHDRSGYFGIWESKDNPVREFAVRMEEGIDY